MGHRSESYNFLENALPPFEEIVVDKARTRQTGGFGLGLSLAKQITEALKGTITVKDNKPKGTIFEVKIAIRTDNKKKK